MKEVLFYHNSLYRIIQLYHNWNNYYFSKGLLMIKKKLFHHILDGDINCAISFLLMIVRDYLLLILNTTYVLKY